MATQMPDEEIYQLAKKRVEEKRGFYSHLIVYLVVNITLLIIWAVGDRGHPWFLWPLGFWGIFVLLQFWGVFVSPKGGPSERREIEKEVEKLKKGQS